MRLGESNVEVETGGKVGDRILRGVKESRSEVEGSILELTESSKVAEGADEAKLADTAGFAWFSRDWVADQIRFDCLLSRGHDGCATLSDLHKPLRSCDTYIV